MNNWQKHYTRIMLWFAEKDAVDEKKRVKEQEELFERIKNAQKLLDRGKTDADIS